MIFILPRASHFSETIVISAKWVEIPLQSNPLFLFFSSKLRMPSDADYFPACL